MTEIDFYVLADTQPERRALLACRLAEKAFDLGHRVFVHVADAAQAKALDELMWTFRDTAFLPHAIASEGNDAPILVGHADEPADSRYLLVNLVDKVPAWFSRFERIAEIIDEQPEVRAAGRERFRFYRDRGYSLRTHKL